MTSTWLVASGSTGTKWSSPRSEAPPALVPFSTMPTRLTSRPRMTGRLEAPGAKLEPVMPGFENRRSPSWAVPWRRISSLGTTVTVANWSVTTGSTPCCGAAATGAGCGSGARSRFWPGAARATRAGVRDGTGLRRTIGLGAVTVISGSCVEAGGAAASCANAPSAIAHSNSQLAPPKWNARFFLDVIVPILIPSMCDGSIPIFPRRIGRVARRSPREVHQSIEVRRRGVRGTGTRDGASRDA